MSKHQPQMLNLVRGKNDTIYHATSYHPNEHYLTWSFVTSSKLLAQVRHGHSVKASESYKVYNEDLGGSSTISLFAIETITHCFHMT